MNSSLSLLLQSYKSRHITLSGYTLQAIQELQLSEINIGFLAEEMGVNHTSLRNTIRKLRKSGLITIPTVDPRSQPKRSSATEN